MPLASYHSLGRLVEALGLQNQHVRRLAIVGDVNSLVTVFVEKLAHEEEVDAVTDMMRDMPKVSLATVAKLEIDDRGRAYVPAALHARALALLRDARATLLLPPGLAGEIGDLLFGE